VRLHGAHSTCRSAGPKSVHSGNGRPLIVLRCLLLMLVNASIRTVNRCCSGFPVSRGIINVGTFNLLRSANVTPLEIASLLLYKYLSVHCTPVTAISSRHLRWLSWWLNVGLVIERSLVQLPARALSSQLGQLSLPSLRGR